MAVKTPPHRPNGSNDQVGPAKVASWPKARLGSFEHRVSRRSTHPPIPRATFGGEFAVKARRGGVALVVAFCLVGCSGAGSGAGSGPSWLKYRDADGLFHTELPPEW